MFPTIEAVMSRSRRYQAARISETISQHDAMFVRSVPHEEALAHYLAVGRSAVEIIAQAMIAAGKTEIANVLDLPCGAGRVTRHLISFFPDAEIYVAELDKRCEAFVVETFGARPFAASPDFAEPPTRAFDLIFVGSLLTHLPAERFAAAVRWFMAALASDGLLVATTHGRRADHCERAMNRHIDPVVWDKTSRAMALDGFGYVETERNAAGSYGYNLAAPSWVLRLIEKDPDFRVVGFHEAAWAEHQDAVVVQRKSLFS